MPRSSRRAALLFALTLAGAPRADAQAAASPARDTAVVPLPAVRIDATRPIARSGGASALELRLDSLRLAPAPTLQTVLRDVPFVQVRVNPRGEGYFANRGSGFDAREVAVIVDGVPASLNFDDRADLALLPLGGARTLTLVRGLPSLLYGPNVLGGLVELDGASAAHPDAPEREGDLALGYDDSGARAAAGRVATRAGGTSLRAGAGYRRSDGFPLPRGVHEPAPFAADDRRLNSDRELADAFVAARHDAPGGAWASLSSFLYSGRRGTPAELEAAAPQLLRVPLMQRSFSVAAAGTGARPSPLGGRGALQLGVGYDAGRTRLESYSSRSYLTTRGQEEDVDRNVNARLVASQSVGAAGDLGAAVTWASVRRHEMLTPGAVAEYRQRLWSAASELGWRAPAVGPFSALRAMVGAAYDASDTPESGDKPAVAPLHAWGARTGVTAASAGGGLIVHAGASRRVRFPALREMYAGNLAGVEPNPDLRPERLVALEAGATAQLGGAQLQAVAFRNDIADAIVRTTANRKVKRVNRDHTRAAGLELLGVVPLGRASLAADLTAQDVASRDASTDTPYQPEYQPKFAGGVRVRAPLPLAASLDVGARGAGAQYCVSAANGYDRLAPAARVDAAVGRAWGGVAATLAVDNLADRAVYDQCGLPQPGRVVRLQVAVR